MKGHLFRTACFRFVGALLFCSLCAIVLAPSAGADTLYTYTGNPFTTGFPPDACVSGVGECQISISFEVASPLPANFRSGDTVAPLSSRTAPVSPLAFSITDGVHTLTQSNTYRFGVPRFSFFEFETGPSGQIEFWNIYLTGQPGLQNLVLSSYNTFAVNDLTAATFTDGKTEGVVLGNSNNPGTWTMSTVPNVPEPSSLMLLGTGLLGMLGLRRKRLA